MATIKVRWTVDELANVMTLFDVQKVYRATTLSPSPDWVEVTGPGTRVALVAGVTSYLFDHLTGDPSYYYGESYYNSVTTNESAVSDPVQADLAGYLTVDDIRDEGFTATMVDDAAVIRGITRSTATIDRVTRQWFEPRTRMFRLDGRRGNIRDLLLNIPVIALTGAALVDSDGDAETITLTDLLVYNRHLTQGLLTPDDRYNPRISWRANSENEFSGLSMKWPRGQQNIQLAGVFGYTELGSYDTPAETTPGSQVPVSYGSTPELIKQAATLLTIQYMYPLVSGEGDEFRMRARIIEERTRDQSYKLAPPSQDEMIWGMTGNTQADAILRMFIRFDLGVV